MTKVLKKQIIIEAIEIRDFIEKNKKLPNTNTINNTKYSIYTTSYLMSKLILTNFKQDIQNITIKKYTVTQHKDTINEDVYKKDYIDMVKRFCSYCEAHHHVPSTIHTKKSNIKVSFELYVYCISKIINFYHKNKYLPNYCLFNKADLQNTKSNTKNTQKTSSKSTSTNKKTVKKDNCTNPYTSTPHYTTTGCNKLGQCTPYYCGPHSIHQAIRKFGITKYTEKQIAAWASTTTSGTGHPGINTAIAKISKESGVKLTVQWKNFSDMGKTDEERFKNIAKILCQPNKAIIWHIVYINGGESTNGKQFGHYEYVDKINVSTKYVRALNSLGTKKNDGSYAGRLQDRPYSVQAYFAKHTSGGQPALCIITKG